MKLKVIGLTSLGLLVSILPPLITTASYFPLWIERSATATVSGVAVFLAILCFVPLYKKILSTLRSPSAPILWTVLAVLMFVMKEIADEMFVVAVVGAISNLVGWAIFKLAKRLRRSDNG